MELLFFALGWGRLAVGETYLKAPNLSAVVSPRASWPVVEKPHASRLIPSSTEHSKGKYTTIF